MRVLLPFLIQIAVPSSFAGCSNKPDCQQYPPFYLRGTAADCQALDSADASKGTRP